MNPSCVAPTDTWSAIRPARVEWHNRTPRSPEYGDNYYASDQGPAESDHVFLQGNHLEQRFKDLRPGECLVIGETGFGTGLNLLLAATRFRQLAPAGSRLRLISAELRPLPEEDFRHGIEIWRDHLDACLAARAMADYPPPCPGFHRLALAGNIDLLLMLGDAAAMWRQCNARVDAWFLDGFAPDRNPAMWSPALFAELAAHSRRGATLATYSAAGSVRRGLQQAGFMINKQPGFGHKRECLYGHRPGDHRPQPLRCGRAVIAGAGLAGATTARALAGLGWQVRVLDPRGVAAGASGNRIGVVYTTPAAHPSPQNRFYQSAYLRALQWLDHHRAEAGGIARLGGAIQHAAHERQSRKLAEAMSSGLWPEQLLCPHGSDAVQLPGGGWLYPRKWCRLLLEHPSIEVIQQSLKAWSGADLLQVTLDHGSYLPADALILCTGADSRKLPGLENLPLEVVRGQVTEVKATRASRQWRRVHCHAGYLTPAIGSRHSIGSSYRPEATDDAPDPRDDRHNLETLRQHLPHHWQALGGDSIEILSARAARRCRCRDYLPAVGSLPDQPAVFLNIAHGSRGITNTPLCAELLADQLSGLPVAVDRQMQAALAPARERRVTLR